MKKITIGSLCTCLSLSALIAIPSVQATSFEGKEEEYMKRCASSTLSTSDKEVCTEFNAYLKDKNKDLKKDIANSETTINNLQNDIASVETSLMNLNNEIVEKEKEIAYLDISIANLQASIDVRDIEIKDRMYSMQSYLNSNSFMDFIFSASNFTDMMSRMDGVKELTDYDKELILDLCNDKIAIEEQRLTVATAKTNLEEQKAYQSTLQEQYLAILNEQHMALQQQQDSSSQLEKYSAEVNEALAALAERSKQKEITGNVSVTGDSEVGMAIANAALTQRGKPYTWGATGTKSYDCSGLVYWAHNQAGVKIGRTTAQGYSRYGQTIPLSETQAGDVVTFLGYGYVCHIGIFIDNNGTIVHATGKENEINGQWGGSVRVNNVHDLGMPIYNCKRMY